MTNVVDIGSFRKAKPVPSTKELAVGCTNDLMQDWERFARNNKLNDFFISSIPSYAQPGVNYLQDLEEISVLEQKLGVAVAVQSPIYALGRTFGWRAAFRMGEDSIETPDMLSEQYARCCNILIYLKLRREMVLLGQ